MHKKNFARTTRRNGAVLAAVLLLGFASVSASALALALADRYRLGIERVIAAAARDSAAEDAMALSYAWFTHELKIRSVDGMKGLFSGQKLLVPASLLLPLREELKSIKIAAVILDQDYESAFEAEAETLDLARGRCTTITLPASDGAAKPETYAALRFEIRTAATGSNRTHTLRRGVIVLYDESGRFYECIDSYTKKKTST